MARIRSIKPEFFTSLSIADLSVPARLHFIGLWTHVDDDGRALDDARLLKAAIWPLDDSMTNVKVAKLQDELEAHGRIIRYEADGRRCIQIVGWHHQKINRKRIDPILRAAKLMLPKADWDQPIESWACLRPSTPDGPPILGPTPYRNLFLNTGHGTLGWTQAAGSASILADIMDGKTPEILMQGLTFGR